MSNSSRRWPRARASRWGTPRSRAKWLVQASRLGERYYVTDPHFEAYAPEVDLGELFAIGLANGDDQANIMRLLNQYLRGHGAQVTA